MGHIKCLAPNGYTIKWNYYYFEQTQNWIPALRKTNNHVIYSLHLIEYILYPPDFSYISFNLHNNLILLVSLL